MKAIDSPNSELYYDVNAHDYACALSGEIVDCYNRLQYTSKPDEIRLSLQGDSGISVADTETNSVADADRWHVAAELNKDGMYMFRISIFVNGEVLTYRYNAERGWTVNGDADEDDRLTHLDIVGEIARLTVTTPWPEHTKHYLDEPSLDSFGMMCFIEDVLLPLAERYHKEVAYITSDYGAPVLDSCGDTDIVLRSVKAGPVQEGKPVAIDDYVYLAVDRPIVSDDNVVRSTQVLAKSSFGTTSTASTIDDGENRRDVRIDEPSNYLQQIRFGLGVISTQKVLDTILENATTE